MIPIRLDISGFLSYRQTATLDFTAFDLACITGPNGAGKSSLLDALTWALFGQARKRDDALINMHSSVASVSLIFAYEGNIYRVQRLKPREKTGVLEFQILQPKDTLSDPPADPLEGTWKPLTERTLRETEARIQQTLHMDYETFINASFFLQGKADQFAQQKPSERKRILSSILGLDVWEVYRERAALRRRQVEAEIRSIEGRMAEIQAELAEEAARKERLSALEADLERLSSQRQAQEQALTQARQIVHRLQEQERLVQVLQRQWESSEARLAEMQALLASRLEERQTYNDLLGRAEVIQADYEAWLATRRQLEQFENLAAQFREQEQAREAPRLEIQQARARLEKEIEDLQRREAELQAVHEEIALQRSQQEALQAQVEEVESRLRQRAELEAHLQEVLQEQAAVRGENPHLKQAMDELKERLDKLAAAEGAACPLCGQPLPEAERLALMERITAEGKEKGDRYRANQERLRQLSALEQTLREQIAALGPLEEMLRERTQALAQVTHRLEALQAILGEWQEVHAPRLAELRATLAHEAYAPEARARLAAIDEALRALGYDAAQHEALRRAEMEGRRHDEAMRSLDKARAALAPLQREIAALEQQVAALERERQQQQEEYQGALQGLEEARRQAPNLAEIEGVYFELQERENRLRQEVGAARQKVLVLDELRTRQKALEARREEYARRVGHYRQLERAFGKDGVQALLIEQTLPQLESKANEILARLTEGLMSVRFVTQSAYKDKTREDLRETLDIQVSDGYGLRDYETFSGGEAFRVNFAIRLALAEVLAQRAGARLQTLVIDEGFGSQDSHGRQRLIEAINLVRSDFAKILVITHIDEFKDAFPVRIEVEKTELGSAVRII